MPLTIDFTINKKQESTLLGGSMTCSNDGNRRIDSLQALRAIAFIGIFLSHAGAPYNWPALGVSVFYAMSGFLMTYKHINDELDCSLKGRAFFSLKRIKKLYPLHILTMICAIVLSLAVIIHVGITLKRLVVLAGEIVLNVFLVQTWVPYSSINVSLNGVAWYLSVTMFLYFMFPVILRFIKKKNIKSLWLMSLLILAVQYFSCLPWIYFLGNDSPIYIWFMYCFSVFRLGDFFVGCTLGKHYANSQNHKYSFVKMSVIEVLMTVVTVGVFAWRKIEQNNLFLLAMHNWTTIFIPIAVIWIYLFTINKGIITKLLTNRLFMFIGNISAYTFLIHYVVTQYTNSALNFLNMELPMNIKLVVIFIEFIITILLTLLYKRFKGEKIYF